MSIFWSVLVAIALCFDTIAVSVVSGIYLRNINFLRASRFALTMALFQGGMPFIGWLAGYQLREYIESVSHWIAFILLLIIGLKMIYSAFQSKQTKKINPLKTITMLSIAVATSIDALTVGVSFAFTDIKIYITCLLIGIITYIASMFGLLIGKKTLTNYGKKYEILGGIILILIGVRIVLG